MQNFKTIKTAFAGIAMAALLPGFGSAQVASVLDDFEGGTNQNKFLDYWYFYNDSGDKGNSVVNSATVSGAELLFDPAKSLDVGNGGGQAALLDFTMGSIKPKYCPTGVGCDYPNFVGIGTGVITEGKVLDMTGATHITFDAKASATMTVVVEVATNPITVAGHFAYHTIELPIGTTWETHSIPLSTEGISAVLKQPNWYLLENPGGDPFDITQVEKVQWKISVENNTGLTDGKLWLDNIVVHGYQWTPPTACMTCVGAPGAGEGAVLSNMDAAPVNQNAAGFFWFAYNDAGDRAVTSQTEYSEIFGGVTVDPAAPTTPVLAIEGNKGYNSTDGAFIEFTLGPSFVEGANTVKPFVGVGTMVSDELGTQFLNATGSTGASFDYQTSASLDFIRFEVKHNLNFGAGIVHHVLLPGTGGEWKSATVPWTNLVLPDWDEVKLIADKTLRINALEKFQWAFQGDAATSGSLAVDNVKIIGLTAIDPTMVMVASIMPRASRSQGGFGAEKLQNGMRVAFSLPSNDHVGMLVLTDMRGKVLSRVPVSAGQGLKRNLELQVSNLPNGVYFLNLTTRSAQGVPFTQKTSVTYMK